MSFLRKLKSGLSGGAVAGTAATRNVKSTTQDIATTPAMDLSEIEANHRLNLYHRAHRWDPNLEDDDLEEVAGAATLHDAETEAKMVNKVIENSPYPEVCITND
jgi:hypothetical protein